MAKPKAKKCSLKDRQFFNETVDMVRGKHPSELTKTERKRVVKAIDVANKCGYR